MSGRCRRSEASWDPKEEKMPPIENHSWGNPEKWPNSEVTDDMAPGRQSWEEKRNDDISRDRHNDEWGNQYSHRPTGDTYGPPYRAHERRVGGNAHMSRDRDRIGSPNQSRTRSRERAQDVTRSRSRSRGRDYWESTRAQTRNPFYDHRQEYSNVRNWNHRQQDYTNDSRYDDYHGHHHHRDDRNQNQIQNQRRQSIRDTRIVACKFFAAGNCNRDDCRFSHDVTESGRYDERSHDNTRAHNLGNRNRAWNEQQSLDDMANSNFLGKNKPWDDGGDIHNHRKRARGDDLGFQDVGKSNHYKKRSWNDADERSRDDDVYDESSHDKKRTWDGDVVGFQDVGKSKSYLDNKKNSWNDEDEKRKKWDGELWGEVSQPQEVKKSGWGEVSQPQEVKNSGWGEVSQPQEVKNSGWGDLTRVKNSDLDLNVVSEDTNQKVVTSVDDVNSDPVSYHFNGPKLQLNGQIEESGKPLKNDGPQFYTTDLNVTNAIDYPKTLPNPEIVEKDSVENKVTENENGKQEKENNNINHHHEKVEKEEEGDVSNDEKAMKLFKVALVEFVKDILKPKWKEGKMSREIHKNVVKKVVEKVTSTMHGLHIPTTQPKIDQYIGYSKSKITKLVEAYVGKLSKA